MSLLAWLHSDREEGRQISLYEITSDLVRGAALVAAVCVCVFCHEILFVGTCGSLHKYTYRARNDKIRATEWGFLVGQKRF